MLEAQELQCIKVKRSRKYTDNAKGVYMHAYVSEHSGPEYIKLVFSQIVNHVTDPGEQACVPP